MIRYITQRLLLLLFLMLVYSFVIFVIIKAPPGDFLTAYVANLSASGTSITAEMIQALRHDYGLDQPFIIQYFHWMMNLLHGNMGLSLEYQRPNIDLISEQLVLTLALALMSGIMEQPSPDAGISIRYQCVGGCVALEMTVRPESLVSAC